MAALALLLFVIAISFPFKIEKPVLTLNGVTITDLHYEPPLHVDLTLTADLSVDNPNPASFLFGESLTHLFYRDREVGVAVAPPGEAPAHGRFRGNVTVDVVADRVLGVPQLVGDLAAGKLPIESSTRVGGKVKFWFIQKHVDVELNCSMTVAVESCAIEDKSCSQRVWL